MHRFLGIVTALGFACLAQPAWVSAAAADTYPSRPIRLISPNPAGGANDTIVRVISAKMSVMLGASIVVDNRGGAGGKIGAEAAARSAPDGYTLLAASVSTHSFAPAVSQKLSYDPVKDFEPISLLATVQNLLVVSNKTPAKNVQELIALVKANPGKLNYASGGPGSTSHFAVAMFIALAGIQDITVHVPFRGGGPAMTATMANDTQFFFSPIAGMVPFVEAGSVRGLAISGDARSPALPNVPTIAEAGMPQYKAVGWFGLMAPAGTPKEIIDRLNREARAILESPETRKFFADQGAEAGGGTPQQLDAFTRAETAKWAKVVKDSGAKVD